MKYFEKTINSERKYTGNIINVEYLTVELPNGKIATRDVVRHSGASVVIPVTDDGYIYLVEQFRAPCNESLLEFPAGKLDKGEAPENCAIRELKEETGLVAENIRKLYSTYTTPGFSDEVLHIFLATGLKETEACPDEDEFLSVKKLSINDAIKMVFNGEITDSKTIIGVLTAERYLDGKTL